MASIKERSGSYQITVSLGRDIYGKKLIETTTFTPDPGLTPKKRQKAVEEFARQFEANIKNGIKTALPWMAERSLSKSSQTDGFGNTHHRSCSREPWRSTKRNLTKRFSQSLDT